MTELDEIGFVETPIEKALLEPIFSVEFEGVWQERLIKDSALLPLYLAKTNPESDLESLVSERLVNHIATFFDRTRMYHSMFNQWMEWIESGDGPRHVTKRSAVYTFVPLFVQELEGPHRYQLAALIQLCKSELGESVSWEDRLYKSGSNKKYFPSLQSEAIDTVRQLQATGDTDDLDDAYDYLLNGLILLAQNDSKGSEVDLKGTESTITDSLGMSGHPNSGDVRNAIAHSDFYIDFGKTDVEESPNIVYEVDGNEHRLNIDGVILFINYQMTLLRALSTGITLSLAYLCLRFDEDDLFEKLV